MVWLPPVSRHLRDTPVYTAWFAGGLRIVDIADPSAPGEVGVSIPPPNPGIERPATNDVGIDKRGLIYTIDRYQDSEIPEFER